MNQEYNDGKIKILKVAERIFSQVGFDGARVDEIAKEAGVNKALIYYYFKSKRNILDTIFKTFIDDVQRLLEVELEDIFISSNSDNLDVLLNKLLNIILDFVLERKNIIKIAVTESLKTTSEPSILFRISDILINAELDKVKKMYEDRGIFFDTHKKQLIITEFFTGIMPLVNFVIFQDEWMSNYKISKEEIKNYFINAFKSTHISYHKTQSNH